MLNRFIKLLVTASEEDNRTGYRTFEPEVYQDLYQIALELIRKNQTHFVFDFFQIIDNQGFTFFNAEAKTDHYFYKKQGGGDLFSYVSLEQKAINRPVIEVTEQLSTELDNGLEICPKTSCKEWAAVLPYILKALIDNCLIHREIGVSFCIREVRFHPIDYRPYAYYPCTRLLLEKMRK